MWIITRGYGSDLVITRGYLNYVHREEFLQLFSSIAKIDVEKSNLVFRKELGSNLTKIHSDEDVI